MAALIPLSSVQPSSLSSEDYVVFGGTFDPVHEGHLSVIRSLMKIFPLTVLAPTTINPWKVDQGNPTPLPLRMEMLRMVLASEKINCSATGTVTGTGLSIIEFDYVYAEQLVHYLRTLRQGQIYWAVGQDIASSVAAWRNWESLQVSTVVAPVILDTHSTMIRQRQKSLHSAIEQFVIEHKLYS